MLKIKPDRPVQRSETSAQKVPSYLVTGTAALMKPLGGLGLYFFCCSFPPCRTGQPVFICLAGMLWRVRNACEVL